MTVFLAILSIITFACLVLVASAHPAKSHLTYAELKRRSKQSKADALELVRYEFHSSLLTVLRTKRAVLLVLLVCLLLATFGWGWGLLIALVLAVVYPTVARLSFVRSASASLYRQAEPSLLHFVAKFEHAVRVLREPASLSHEPIRRIHSQEDLQELIQHSEDIIGKEERLLLSSAMLFFGKTVEEVMTPRSMIDFIKGSEFLGPLVLDELHAKGHSRLPVIGDDLDHIIGVLHLRDLLSLDVRRSVTAEKAMEKKVYYIHQNDTLEHALAAFIKTRHHLFVVINGNRETVGLLSLEDTIEAMIGRQIIDEDDIHEDLRAVAEREGQRNNKPEGHIDL